MGWLDKLQKEQLADGSSEAGKGTIIGPGLMIEGKIQSDEDIWVAGKVNGEVLCKKKIIVAATGVIHASVVCNSIVIFGEVRGNVEAKEQVTIEPTGKVIGDLHTKIFTNRPGGFFEGYSHMLDARNQDLEASSTESGEQEVTETQEEIS